MVDMERNGAGRPARAARGGKARRQPLYAKVHEALRRGIADGRWSPGERLPTETELCRSFGVSRITVRHALQLLREDGTIATRSARPAVVVNPRGGSLSAGRLDTLDDLVAGASGVTLDIRAWQPERRREAARIFGLLAATTLPCLSSILLRDRRPFARSAIYFHPSVGARLRREHFDDVLVFRVMQRELGISIRDVKMTATAEAATAADAADLGIVQGSPMLCSRLVFRTDRNAPVQVSYTRFPAGSYAVTHTLDLTSLG